MFYKTFYVTWLVCKWVEFSFMNQVCTKFKLSVSSFKSLNLVENIKKVITRF